MKGPSTVPHSFISCLLCEYDIRGIIGQTFTPEIRTPCSEEKTRVVVEQIRKWAAAREDERHRRSQRAERWGWPLLRAADSQDTLARRFEAATPDALKAM